MYVTSSPEYVKALLAERTRRAQRISPPRRPMKRVEAVVRLLPRGGNPDSLDRAA